MGTSPNTCHNISICVQHLMLKLFNYTQPLAHVYAFRTILFYYIGLHFTFQVIQRQAFKTNMNISMHILVFKNVS